jgi:DNA-binding MarR family transcriptional regulator
MSGSNRVSITAGDIEIELEGATIEVNERLGAMKEDDTWTILIERIRDAREAAIEAAQAAAKDAGLPERGSAFAALLSNCSLTKKPDQVLGAIHYLREVESLDDAPPRVINKLFEDAGLNPPDNLSLYLNRLRERGFLEISQNTEDKNRYAILTSAGREHLNKRSSD